MEAVRTQNPPIFTGETKPEREALLAGLKRKLFSAQAKAVHAATTLLCDHDEKSAIINGEMGVGKTTMGIATAALLHAEGYPRALILSPPHLVYKWRREILDTVPQAEVVILNGADTFKQLQALRQSASLKPKNPVFYILGRVRLRLGHHWRVAVQPRLATTTLRTPQGNRGSRSESSCSPATTTGQLPAMQCLGEKHTGYAAVGGNHADGSEKILSILWIAVVDADSSAPWQ